MGLLKQTFLHHSSHGLAIELKAAMTSRLEILSASLAAKLYEAPLIKQRLACVAACELATKKARVENPLVVNALGQLRNGHVFTPQEKAEIDAIVAQLDDEYFNLQEEAEAGGVSAEDYLRVFAKARAIAAISFAGSKEKAALAEAIYEAAAAVGSDKAELFSYVDAALK
ncbi:MAG: hypothetical protein QM783_07350 [Phycisphaerales bacterium]